MLSLIQPACFILLTASFQHLVTATSLISTGQTFLLNAIPYYIPATPSVTISPPTSLKKIVSDGGFTPVTVVRLSPSNATLTGLEKAIDGFKIDDVWNAGFLEGEWII